MSRHRPGIVGTALAALAFSGCGEDPGVEGTAHFTKTNTEAYASQIDEMKKTTKEKAHLKKDEEKAKPAADSKSRPAADSRAAPDTRPAADSRAATKGG